MISTHQFVTGLSPVSCQCVTSLSPVTVVCFRRGDPPLCVVTVDSMTVDEIGECYCNHISALLYINLLWVYVGKPIASLSSVIMGCALIF